MEAKNVNIPAGADAEFDAKLVGGEGDVAGGDIGLGISGGQFLEAAFVQREDFEYSEPLTKGGEVLYRLRADIKMRVPAQFAKAQAAGPVEGPGLENRLSRLEEETRRGPLRAG